MNLGWIGRMGELAWEVLVIEREWGRREKVS